MGGRRKITRDKLVPVYEYGTVREHVDEIMSVETACFPEDDRWTAGQYMAEGGQVILCRVLKTIVGCVVWKGRNVISIGVLPPRGCEGLGTALLAKALERMHKRSPTVYAEVECTNDRSLRVFRKFGFVELYRIHDFYGPGRSAFKFGRERP